MYIANHERLQNLHGDTYTFPSHDNSNVSAKVRKSVDAPKKLFLKIGAPVILTVNLSCALVNGSQGHVVSVEEDSVVVKFVDSN